MQRTRFGSQNSSEEHKPKLPTDKRREHRRSFGVEGGLKVEVTTKGGSFLADALDISPAGIGLVTREFNPAVLPKVGQPILLAYRKGSHIKERTRGMVMYVTFKNVGDEAVVRIGVAFLGLSETERADASAEGGGGSKGRAHGKRFPCPEFFRPLAYCEDPFFFQEKIHFQVMEFHRNGMTLHTSARNKSLVPGVVLHVIVFLPLVGTYEVEAKVKGTRKVPGVDRYAVIVDTDIDKPELKDFGEGVTQYLLLSGVDVSVEELKNEQFLIGNMGKALKFCYVNSQDDLAKIELLRAESLARDLSLERNTPEDGIIDEFDTHSRQVVCKLGKRIIGSGRVILVSGNPKHSELESKLCRLPREIWDTNFVEVSWICFDAKVVIPDVFIHFMRHFARVTIESGHRYLLTTCAASTWTVYRELGFKTLPVEFYTEKARQDGIMVVALDVRKALEGAGGMKGSVWNKVFEPVAEHVGLARYFRLDYAGAKAKK